MLATGSELLELIPQKKPFVMIDKLFFSDREKTISGFTIKKDCILCRNGFLSESGLVENIAQTAAAGVGYICKQENIPVPIGFIAAIKNLAVYDLPVVGSEVISEVVIRNNVMDITIVYGKVTHNDTMLAECELRIFIKSH